MNKLTIFLILIFIFGCSLAKVKVPRRRLEYTNTQEYYHPNLNLPKGWEQIYTDNNEKEVYQKSIPANNFTLNISIKRYQWTTLHKDFIQQTLLVIDDNHNSKMVSSTVTNVNDTIDVGVAIVDTKNLRSINVFFLHNEIAYFVNCIVPKDDLFLYKECKNALEHEGLLKEFE